MGKGATSSRLRWFCSIAFAALLKTHLTKDFVVAERNGDSISASWCPEEFYVFGDSLSDTGNGVHFVPEYARVLEFPYGEAFFGRPTGRFSSGRLFLDFILLSFKLPLLTPSWRVAGTETRGANFALAGATAARISRSPSCLEDQLSQFVEWKTQAETSAYLSGGDLNSSKKLNLSSALFVVDAGGNDLTFSAVNGYTYDDLFLISGPALIKAIVTTVQALYLEGARKFLVPNVPPEGCVPAAFTSLKNYPIDVDTMGCLEAINAFNRGVNGKLHLAVQQLREALPDATIIFFDRFSVNLEVLNNPAKYGFDPDLVSAVCCGAPGLGAHNYNPSHLCGASGFTVCEDPEKYVNWDGWHYSEHYYRVLAQHFLSGVYSDPPTNLTAVCSLTYEYFGPDVTYEDVYFPNSSIYSST